MLCVNDAPHESIRWADAYKWLRASAPELECLFCI